MKNVWIYFLILIIPLLSCNESIVDVGTLRKTVPDIIVYVTKDSETFGGVTVFVRHHGKVIHNERADINGMVHVYTSIEGLIIIEGAIGPYYGKTQLHKKPNKNAFVELRMEPHP